MALWAGLVPVLVSVKIKVVVAPSAMVAAPKVLATVGVLTLSVCVVTALMMLPVVLVIWAEPFA